MQIHRNKNHPSCPLHPASPPREELPFPLLSPLPSEGLLCSLQVWDVAGTPRRELTPRTGCESGIPASHWKHPPCAPPSSVATASSEYLRGEEVRRII